MEIELNDHHDLAQSIPTVSIIYRYRLGAGPEINNVDEPDTIQVKAAFVSYCANAQGDVDSSGAVTPQDAQNVFEYYLGTYGGELSDYCAQCDGDDTGVISPGDAQAIFDVYLGNKAACDGSFKTQAK